MKIPDDMLIAVQLEGWAAKLKPIVFHDGITYCVLYGEQPETGIYAIGNSIGEALSNWNHHLESVMGNDIQMKKILADHEPPESVTKFLEAYKSRAKTDDTGYNLNKSF